MNKKLKVALTIASPPQCVFKKIIDRFDNWFESKHKLTLKCFCNASNKCDGVWQNSK